MSLSPLRVALVAVLTLPVVPLAHCTSTATTPPSNGTIGVLGGSLASTDYAIEITVPPGALSESLSFTITGPITTIADAGTVLQAPLYSISACPLTGTCTGETTSQPLIISYTQQALLTTNNPIADWSDYRVAYYTPSPDAGLPATWSVLPNQSVDSVAQTIEATTMNLSSTVYGVFIPATSSSSPCATIDEPRDDGGCSPVIAVPGKCAPFPGSVTQRCANDGGATIEATCCYPTGAPLCFTQAEKGCDSPCLAIPGSTATSCMTVTLEAGTTAESTCCLTDPSATITCTPQPPSMPCGTASPCTGGAFASSCYDVGNGGVWTCCSIDGGASNGDASTPDSGNASDGASTNDSGARDAGIAGDSSSDGSTVDAGIEDTGAGAG
jgi:hypothetical protein